MLPVPSVAAVAAALLLTAMPTAVKRIGPDKAIAAVAPDVKAALLAKHGEAERARIERGVDQVAAAWRSPDGPPEEFRAFLESQFLPAGRDLDLTFERLEAAFEQLDGHFVEIDRELSRHAALDTGPLMPVDTLLSSLDAGAHLVEDLFASKLAFVALANFRLTTLPERLTEGDGWSRRAWAEARLTGRVARRVPGFVTQGIARAAAEADLYVSEYNLFVHHLLGEKGERLFPRGKKLVAHWGLRDEIKGLYGAAGALPRQRALARAMERIVAQEIPRAAVDDPRVDWNPFTNEVRPAPADTVETGEPPPEKADPAREPDTRYRRWLDSFRAVRAADPYSPMAPTHVRRRFELETEIPEERVVELLKAILESPLVPRVAKLVERRLGRRLEPLDIWYEGFQPRAAADEAELDRRARERFPTVSTFEAALPSILGQLGFTPDAARFVAGRMAVDPARGAGHALGAMRRGDLAHLRTRFGPLGMDYQGFSTAIHELGHNVEQVFSLHRVDHTLLQGVPNAALSEAIAFVFQARDQELLALAPPGEEARRLLALHDLWQAYEIAGVALLDIAAWHWMYRHPEAQPAELREATLALAREIWNRYYAPVLGARDSTLLAVYAHLVAFMLYVPDYPLGHLAAAQIEEHLAKAGDFGREVERITSHGAVAPDLWMKHATGEPLSAAALLRAAERALAVEERSPPAETAGSTGG